MLPRISDVKKDGADITVNADIDGLAELESLVNGYNVLANVIWEEIIQRGYSLHRIGFDLASSTSMTMSINNFDTTYALVAEHEKIMHELNERIHEIKSFLNSHVFTISRSW